MTMHKKRWSGLLPTVLIVSLVVSTSPVIDGCSRSDDQPAPSPQPSVGAPPAAQAPPPTVAPSPMPTAKPAAMQPGPAPGAATAEELQQLVSPIALYPDMLIGQILAVSTYPTQVVEADRFMKAHPGLTGDALAAQVKAQPWDPSVKSLCQFPTVLNTMSQSLSWTSAVGEAYYNQPDDVMAAIQVMRKRAMAAGTLKSTPQQKVEVQSPPAAAASQGAAQQPAVQGGAAQEPAAAEGITQPAAQPAQQQVVVIQPAQSDTVYVPQYNPSTVYGAPVAQPVGYSGTEMLAAGVVGFGAGMLLGSLINNGYNDWGCNWSGGNVVYNNNVWASNSAFMTGRRWYAGYGRATDLVRCRTAVEPNLPPIIQILDPTSPRRNSFLTVETSGVAVGSAVAAA
jgi:hypothetical protein